VLYTSHLVKRSRGLWLFLSVTFFGFITAPTYSYAELLTIESALALAQRNNPELRKATASLEAVKGELTEANSPLFNNPTVNLEGGSRKLYDPTNSDSRRSEWNAGVAQTFELAGQQGFRRQTANAKLTALQQEIDEVRHRVNAEVEERFVQVLALQMRIETEQHTLELTERNTDLVGKRVEAGEDSKLDGNLASVETERARNQISLLQEQLTRVRAALAVTLQLPEQQLPTVLGELSPVASTYTLDDLLASVAGRPALKALSWREQSARSTLDLERAVQTPDLTLSLSYGRDAVVGGQDSVTSLGLSLPIPLFRKNAAGIGRATSELSQIEIEKNTLTRDARASVVAAWQRRQSLQDRVQRLTTAVYPKLEENLRFSQVAFKNGEIALPQLLLVQRQVIDAQRDLIEAQLDLRLTQIELEYAAGWPARTLANQQ
jgi:cobalt-zinc-cadmium efflux system outer membrane protein